ncbi:glycosyltransferase family 2 protein [Kineosporia succinea]|uniref:Glycosyltransferase involved in cell wall biosynthesis n=1 Tax=Kineosporia succinea TaxID=84632 RepID=A0ABT9NWK1_9ACTN|nr:glycosyltransferase [Kineosporia succinea]MDP9824701.1 glycosyltransferase involved in cell wall biosynthesis [Kineosporia succinea]
MSVPTLSVIVTCRNSARTLEETLESIVSQTYAGWWEVVVVDNASTDTTVEVAEAFSARFAEVSYRVLRVPNPGHQAAGLNHGIASTTGEALVFVDSDDLVAEGYLQRMGEVLATAGLAGGELDVVRLNPVDVRHRREPLQVNRIDTLCGFRPAVVGATMGARREPLERIGGFDEALPTQHDLDLSWRLAGIGVQPVFVPGAVVHYRYRLGPREIFEQERGYGVGEVLLYRKFRPLGMRRRGPRAVVGSWVGVLRALTGVLLPGGPSRLATRLGMAVGHVEGSRRHRTLYL